MTILETKLTDYRILPVVTPYDVDGTVQLAKALADGGIKAIEVTLRTEAATEALKAVKTAGINIDVGVGTLTSADDVEKAAEIGVEFGVSPGVTTRILDAAKETGLQLLPGVSGPSDILLGFEYGLEIFKLFPAGAVNGPKMLKALNGPFPNIKFCPTGGVSNDNAMDYLNMPNVLCVGGSWMVPDAMVKAGNWDQITALCAEAMATVSV